jgi:hypothetical protein
MLVTGGLRRTYSRAAAPAGLIEIVAEYASFKPNRLTPVRFVPPKVPGRVERRSIPCHLARSHVNPRTERSPLGGHGSPRFPGPRQQLFSLLHPCRKDTVIDEAHKLPDPSLEDIRLLTITDFDRKTPFVLLLAGQPALDDRLADPTHYALDQRITTVARLNPLSDDETRQYILTRLNAAGAGKKQPVFEDTAMDAIFEASGGVPRRINTLATSALIVAAARKQRLVCAQDVHDALLDRARP